MVNNSTPELLKFVKIKIPTNIRAAVSVICIVNIWINFLSKNEFR